MKLYRKKPLNKYSERKSKPTKAKSDFLSKYPGPKGSNSLLVKDGKITSELQSLVKTFCFIVDKKASNFIKCCAGYKLKIVKNRVYINRLFSCVHSNPIAIYTGEVKIKSAFALDLSGRIIHFNIHKEHLSISSLTTAINKMDTVTVENLKASTKSKIDISGKSNNKSKLKKQKEQISGQGQSSTYGGGSRY